MAADDPGHEARQARLIEQHGMPEAISAADALALARTALTGKAEPDSAVYRLAGVKAGDIHASIYRDPAAADAWLESNLIYYGHPALARVPLPDGRVAGILDLRPSLKRLEDEQ